MPVNSQRAIAIIILFIITLILGQLWQFLLAHIARPYATFSSTIIFSWYCVISSYIGCWLWSSCAVFLNMHIRFIAQRVSIIERIKIIPESIIKISKVFLDVSVLKPVIMISIKLCTVHYNDIKFYGWLKKLWSPILYHISPTATSEVIYNYY